MKQKPQQGPEQLTLSIPGVPRPIWDSVLLELISEFEGIETLLALPETVMDKSRHAIVRAMGPGRVTDSGILIEPQFQVGDKVFFNPNHAVRFSANEDGVNKDFMMIQQNWIIGVFPPMGPMGKKLATGLS